MVETRIKPYDQQQAEEARRAEQRRVYRRNQVFGMLLVAAAISLESVPHQSEMDLPSRMVASMSPSRRANIGSAVPEPLAVLLLGPTGSGKTALSLALGERFGGEIISCDSVAVYRGMELGYSKAHRRRTCAPAASLYRRRRP